MYNYSSQVKLGCIQSVDGSVISVLEHFIHSYKVRYLCHLSYVNASLIKEPKFCAKVYVYYVMAMLHSF